MIMRAHLRNIAIATFLFGSPQLVLAATFQGPAQQPPSGNAPGVIWNMKDNPATVQTGAVINVPGLRNDPTLNDLYITSGKSFHIDQNGASTYQMGNWGGSGGSQKPLTFYLNGDIQVSDFSPYTSQGTRGRVQASEFCFNPGSGPSDCISDWASAGGSGFVLKTGDRMTGPLLISKNFSGSVGTTSTVDISSVALLGSTFTEMNAFNAAISPPNSANAAGVMNGVKSRINQSGGSTTLSQSSAVYGNNANTGSINDYAYGGNFIASVNTNGRINQEVAGVHGQFNATTDFNTINRALGVFGDALNSSPTKSPTFLIGVQGYAQGKALTDVMGVYGKSFINANVSASAKQQGVVGEVELSGGGTGGTVYGVRGAVVQSGGVATTAYGVYGNVSGVNATNLFGVYGNGGASGNGVYGYGDYGVEGLGISTGGYFTGQLWGVYGIATSGGGAGVRGAAGSGVGSGVGVYGSASPSKIAVLAESETLNQGTPLQSRYGAIGADIRGSAFGMKVSSAGGVGVDIDSGTVGVRASSTNQAALFDNNTNGVYSRSLNAGLDGRTYGNAGTSYGVYGHSELAAGSAGRFNNPLASTEVYLAKSGYSIDALGPVNVKTTGNAQMFYINNNGEVHTIGGIYPGYYFHDRVTPATKWFAWYADTSAGVPTARLYNNSIGDVLKVNYTNGQIFNYANTASFNIASDERLKDIRGEYSKGLEVLSRINPIIFNYKKNNPQKIESTITHQGVSAQELIKVLPEAVQMGEDGYLTVNNDPIIWASVNSIKQLKSENDELKSKIETLEQRLNKLEEKLK